MNTLPVEAQTYLASILLGLALPLIFFWMLLQPLKHFLALIFGAPQVERFWLRLILLVLVCSSFSVAVGYHPNEEVRSDYVALVWSLADQTRAILDGLLWGMLAVFLPLLLAYMVLYAGRGARRTAPNNDPPCPTS